MRLGFLFHYRSKIWLLGLVVFFAGTMNSHGGGDGSSLNRQDCVDRGCKWPPSASLFNPFGGPCDCSQSKPGGPGGNGIDPDTQMYFKRQKVTDKLSSRADKGDACAKKPAIQAAGVAGTEECAGT